LTARDCPELPATALARSAESGILYEIGGDMDRAFHTLTIRTISEDKRIIEGWATTARTDRTGDIVEPLGSEFELPLPLLLDHDHRLAVGEVEQVEVTSKGIRFLARIKKIDEPGQAKDLTDAAWHYAKHGLRKCVSIGFQPLDYDTLPGGGLRFTRWSWHELSLCAVPANPDAVIETVKQAHRAGHVLKLTPREKLRGRILADGERRAAARKRLGIHGKPVKLDASDIVNAKLAARRKRQANKARQAIRVIKL
jgi:uncharacterized protein